MTEGRYKVERVWIGREHGGLATQHFGSKRAAICNVNAFKNVTLVSVQRCTDTATGAVLWVSNAWDHLSKGVAPKQ